MADLDLFETHIQQFISKIPRDGSTIDLQPLFFNLTLDTATEFLFGESVDSLNATTGSEEDRFQKAYDLAQSRLANRGRLGRLIYLCRDAEFDEACQIVHRFVDKIIFKALEKLHPHDAEKSIDGKTEPERYVFLTEMLKSTTDPKQLRDELLNILLAGRDTTASLLSNTFHVLARRPDIWKKLKAEVDELGGKRPDYETLRNMKYLKYLLNECMSLSFTKLISQHRTNLTSTPPLPRRPKQRPLRPKTDPPPPRRRTHRRLASTNPQRRHRRLPRMGDAPTEGHLRSRRRRVPTRALGERPPALVGLPAVQRRAADLRRPAVCADGGGLYDCEAAAGFWRH